MQTGARSLASNTQNRNGISRSRIERGDNFRARRTGSPDVQYPCRLRGYNLPPCEKHLPHDAPECDEYRRAYASLVEQMIAAPGTPKAVVIPSFSSTYIAASTALICHFIPTSINWKNFPTFKFCQKNPLRRAGSVQTLWMCFQSQRRADIAGGVSDQLTLTDKTIFCQS